MSTTRQPAADKSPSRRDFIKSSTVAVVGGSLAAHLVVPSAVYAQGSSTVKVGVIGCGGRGTGAAKDVLLAGKDVQIVAMADTFQHKLDSSHQALKKDRDLNKQGLVDRVAVTTETLFVGLDGYKKVLAADVDLVILATPPGFRPQHFAAAVEAGKHVFMEKPVAVDAPGVHTVLQAGQKAKQKNLGVGVGLQRRHQLTYLETMKRLQDGMIGEIHTMRAYWNGAGVWGNRKTAREWLKDATEMQVQVHDWYWYNWLSGDHICEQHIHNLDVCNWLKGGYPVKAQGMGGREVRTAESFGDIYDHHAVEFEYEDGARMFSFCRHIPGCWNSVSEHCQGTKGRSDINRAMIEGDTAWRYRGPTNNPYRSEHADLLDSIAKGEPLNEAEYGAMSSMTAILGRMCTYSGRELTMEKALASKQKLGPEDGFTWDTTPPVPRVAVPGQTEVL